MIGATFNPDVCIFIATQSLNANQLNPNVPDSGNTTTHNLLFDTDAKSLIWVDTKTNIIVQESPGPLPTPPPAPKCILKGLISQTGVSAPTTIEQVNTFPEPLEALTYVSPGKYKWDWAHNIKDVDSIHFYLSETSNHPSQTFHMKLNPDFTFDIITGQADTDVSLDNLLIKTPFCIELW